jgi:hypothetical protein
MSKEDQIVESVFGRMTRREMLVRLGMSGLAIGLAGTSALRDASGARFGDVQAPPIPLSGTPFREIKKYQTLVDPLFDLDDLQRFGLPKSRTRDTKWLDKPTNSMGVSLLSFTNSPQQPMNSCGQAASATLLNFYKMTPAGLTGDAVTNKIYDEHPPDGGERGTSFPYAVQTIQSYGLKTWTGRSNELGEATMLEKLKAYVSQGKPAVVLLDMRKPMRIAAASFLGHFTVVYAYSDTHVYMTNWNDSKRNGWLNDWDTFKEAWAMADCRNHHLMAVSV